MLVMELIITYLEQIKAIYHDGYNPVNIKEEPFSIMMKNKSLEDYGFKLDGNLIENEKIFHLAVKANKIGAFHFFINKEEMEKEALIPAIEKLKEIEIVDEASAKKKVQKLLKALKAITTYFALVSLYEESFFSNDLLKSIMGEGLIYFNAEAKKKTHRLPKVHPHKEKEAKNPINLGETFSKNKFHFLTILVDALLLSATISEAILSFKQENTGFGIAMLAFAAISLVLITVTFASYLKKHPFKDIRFLLSCVVDIIGLGLGCALFIGFYYMSINNKSTEGLPSLGELIGIGLAIAFAVNALCVGIVCLVFKIMQVVIGKKEGTPVQKKPIAPIPVKKEQPVKQEKPVKQPKPAPAPASKTQPVIKEKPVKGSFKQRLDIAFSCGSLNMIGALVLAMFAAIFLFQGVYSFASKDIATFVPMIVFGCLFLVGVAATLFASYKHSKATLLTYGLSMFFSLIGILLGSLVYLVMFTIVNYGGEPSLALGANYGIGLGITFGGAVILTLPIYLLGSIFRKPVQ